MKLRGWKREPGPPSEPQSCPVWKHETGIRLHLGGLALIRDIPYWASMWPESQESARCIRICGGNRKRGLMLWAMRKGGAK